MLEIYSKTTNKTGSLRTVLLTPAALELITAIRAESKETGPNGKPTAMRSFEAYRLAVLRACDMYPHFLRHSSAQAMADAGVREEHIRIAMGRMMARTDRCYIIRPNYSEALKSISILSDLVPMSILEVIKQRKSA